MLSASVASAFPNVARDPIARTNTLLVASTRPVTAATCSPPPGPAGRPAPARRRGGRPAGAPLRGGEVYTDDRAPVEWLIDKSIIEYAAGE